MPVPSLRLAAALILALSIMVIGGAWFFELVVKLAPCPLCLEQRWPWYAAIALGLCGAFLGNSRLLARAAVLGLAALMLWSLGLAIYHAGVEWDFWQGPAGCSQALAMPEKAGDLLGALQTTQVPSCKEAAWRFLGLSLAGWNALVSIGALVLIATALRADMRNAGGNG